MKMENIGVYKLLFFVLYSYATNTFNNCGVSHSNELQTRLWSPSARLFCLLKTSTCNLPPYHGCNGSFTLRKSDSETDTDSRKFYCQCVSVSGNISIVSYKQFTSRFLYRTRVSVSMNTP